VLDTKNKKSTYYEYPEKLTADTYYEFRHMDNGIFIYHDAILSKLFILDLKRGFVNRTYKLDMESSASCVYSQNGVTTWFYEPNSYISYNFVGDTLVYNSKGKLLKDDILISRQTPKFNSSIEKYDPKAGIKLTIERNNQTGAFDSKTQQFSDYSSNYYTMTKQSPFGFHLIRMYKYHTPAFSFVFPTDDEKF
jgi:hypothetical protein